MDHITSSDFQKNLFQIMRETTHDNPVFVTHKTLGEFVFHPVKKKNKIKFGGGEGHIVPLVDDPFEGWSKEIEDMFEGYI